MTETRQSPIPNDKAHLESKHRRIWMACERCRSLKIKCTNESPCKRCRNVGIVCVPGSRKKKRRDSPNGYPEMLEYDHITLVATVQTLYEMIKKLGGWNLEPPQVNDQGLPIAQSIAERLGCVSRLQELNSTSVPVSDDCCKPKTESVSPEPVANIDTMSIGRVATPPLAQSVSPCSSAAGLGSAEQQTSLFTQTQQPLPQDLNTFSQQEFSPPLDTNSYPYIPKQSFTENEFVMPLSDTAYDQWFYNDAVLFDPAPTVNPAMLQEMQSPPPIFSKQVTESPGPENGFYDPSMMSDSDRQILSWILPGTG